MKSQIILGEITRHVCGAQGIGLSQHRFMKGRSCLSNLISLYDWVTRLLDEGKAADVIYLDFSKAFDMMSLSILLRKLAVHGLDMYTLFWIKNWQEGCAQQVVVNGPAGDPLQVMSPRGPYWGPSCLISLLIT